MAIRTDFAAGEVLAAADLNDTFGAKANLASPTFTGNVVWSASTLRAAGATVATAQNFTNQSYSDLATAGPAVTLTTGTRALVIIGARTFADVNGSAFMSFAVSGATTVAASDDNSLEVIASAQGVPQLSVSRAFFLTGLTAGSNTFTAKYKATSGSSYWQRRTIYVMDMGS